MNKQENGSDKTVLAAIETIEEVDFLLITQLTAWFVLSGYLEIMRNGSDILIRTGDIDFDDWEERGFHNKEWFHLVKQQRTLLQ